MRAEVAVTELTGDELEALLDAKVDRINELSGELENGYSFDPRESEAAERLVKAKHAEARLRTLEELATVSARAQELAALLVNPPRPATRKGKERHHAS